MSVLYSIFYFFERSARLGLPRAAGEKKKKNACQFIFNNVHLLCCLVIEDNAENNFLQAVKWDHLTCRRVVLSGSPAWHNWTVKVRLSGRMCCCLFYFTVSTLWLCHEATGPFGSNEYVKKQNKTWPQFSMIFVPLDTCLCLPEGSLLNAPSSTDELLRRRFLRWVENVNGCSGKSWKCNRHLISREAENIRGTSLYSAGI